MEEPSHFARLLRYLMKLKIFLLVFFFSAQSFSSENIILNFHDKTDEQTLSYAILLPSINKYSCLQSLSNPANDAYQGCRQKAREKGRDLKDASGNQLYYTTCEFYVYASKNCTGNKIGTLSLDRGPRSNKYVNEAALKSIDQLNVRIRNDDEYNNTNPGPKGYVLLESRNKGQLDITIRNTIYYKMQNKSNSYINISINSPCVPEMKIKNVTISSHFPGSTWSIPNWWVYDSCKKSPTCSIYFHEILKSKGQKDICGNTIGAIDIDLENKNNELIGLYDYKYQLSIEPYFKTPFQIRRLMIITNQINK